MNASSIATAGIALAALLASHHGHAQTSARDEGRAVFDRWCVHCHGAGSEMPGTTALSAKYRGAVPPLLEQRTDLRPEITKHFVRNGVSIMPFFRKTEISDRELQSLARYLDRSQADTSR